MERARTPLGSVPISTIYGYEYPLDQEFDRIVREERSKLESKVSNVMRTSRASSESRVIGVESFPLRSAWEPSALMTARNFGGVIGVSTPANRPSSPISFTSYRDVSLPPAGTTGTRKYWEYPTVSQRQAMESYSGSNAWNTTGFYYSPRYPESYRGTASALSIPYSRRYPQKRFIASYRPSRIGRGY